MSTFSYFATFDESLSVLNDLCAAGFRVVPNRRYERAEAPAFDRVTDELVEILSEGPVFLLTGAFSRHPLQLTRLGRGPAEGRFVIDFMQGPVLAGMLARVNPVDGEQRLLLGDLSYQPRYTNPETGRREKAASDLKAAFNLAVATTRRRMVSHPIAGEVPIGPAALALALSGAARLKLTVLPNE